MFGTLIPRATAQAGSQLAGAASYLMEDGTGTETRAGPAVNEHVSLTLPAVFRAVDNLTSHLGMLPCRVLKKTGDDTHDQDRDHPVWRLLNRRPNPEMAAINFRRAIFLHTLLWGNGRSEIEWRVDGRPKWLWLLLPHLTTTKRDHESKRIFHEVWQEDGEPKRVFAENALHTTGLSYDGIMGYGLIDMLAKQNLGLHLAMTEFAQAFFGNNAMLGVILSAPEKVGKEVKAEALKALTETHGGTRKAFKAMVVGGGEWKVQHASQQNDHSQLIEQQTFAVQDVGRWLNVPPPLLMELSHATYSNIEELGNWYVRYSLTPWFEVFEQEWEWKLFRPDERDVYKLRFVPEQLLRGDITKRFDAHTKALASGFASIDEVRSHENMNPLPNGEGKKYRVPLNMTTTDADEEPAAKAPPVQSQAPPLRPRNAAVTASFEQVFEDTADRVLRRSMKAAADAGKRYDGKPDAFAEWADKFYFGHEKYVFDAFWPQWKAFCVGLLGSCDDVDENVVDRLDQELRVVAARRWDNSGLLARTCVKAVTGIVRIYTEADHADRE